MRRQRGELRFFLFPDLDFCMYETRTYFKPSFLSFASRFRKLALALGNKCVSCWNMASKEKYLMVWISTQGKKEIGVLSRSSSEGRHSNLQLPSSQMGASYAGARMLSCTSLPSCSRDHWTKRHWRITKPGKAQAIIGSPTLYLNYRGAPLRDGGLGHQSLIPA